MQPREVTEKQTWLDKRNAERNKIWAQERKPDFVRPTVRAVRAIRKK